MDFFALEAPLIARLAEKLRLDGAPVDVVSVRALTVDSENEPVLRVPAVLVSFDGYEVPESTGTKARIKQTWSATVVVANLRDRARAGARDDGALLVDQVSANLLGWAPPIQDQRAYRPLQMTNPAYAVSYGKRNAYIPLSFTTERALTGARN